MTLAAGAAGFADEEDARAGVDSRADVAVTKEELLYVSNARNQLIYTLL